MVQFHRKVNKSSDFMESFLARNETTRTLFRVCSRNFFRPCAASGEPKQQERRERGSLPSSQRETGSPTSLAKRRPTADRMTAAHRLDDASLLNASNPPYAGHTRCRLHPSGGTLPNPHRQSRIHTCKLPVSFLCIFRTLSFSHLSHVHFSFFFQSRECIFYL